MDTITSSAKSLVYAGVISTAIQLGVVMLLAALLIHREVLCILDTPRSRYWQEVMNIPIRLLLFASAGIFVARIVALF